MTIRTVLIIPIFFVSIVSCLGQIEFDLNKIKNSARKFDDATGASVLIKKKFFKHMTKSRKAFEESSFTYAVSLSDNAGLYENEEKYGKYKKYLLEVINSKNQQSNTPNETASNMMEAGEMLYAAGHYNQAERSFRAARLIYEKEGDTTSILYARVISNIGLLQHTTGRYDKGEKNTLKALKIRKALFMDPNEVYAASINNLAVLYKDMGKYSESEKLINEALELNEKTLGKTSIPYALSLNNQGMLFLEMGRYEEAESLLKIALKTLDKAQRGKSSSYIRLMMNLAVLYQEMRKYDESETIYLEAIKLKERKLGKRHPDYGHLLSNLAGLYMLTEKYDKVESLLKDALTIYEKKFGSSHPSYASSLYNLGNYYRIIKNYGEAESKLIHCTKIREAALGTNHPDYVDARESIGLLYWESGKKKEAYLVLKEVLDQTIAHIHKYFAPLSEAEKTRYWEKMRIRFKHFYSFASTAAELPRISYDLVYYQINTKALLLNSSTKVKNKILNGKDNDLKKQYLNWLDHRQQLSYYYSLSKKELGDENINLDSLENITNRLEKQLSESSSIFNEGYKKKLLKPEEAAKYLKASEASIEIIHYNKFNKFLQAESGYLALIITAKNPSNPELVIIENGSDLESKFYNYYRNTIRQKLPDTKSHEVFWQKIETALPLTAKTIFVSTDGIYNQVNLNTLKDKDNKYLVDNKTIIYLTNTKDLIEKRGGKQKTPALTAALFAYPDYGPSGSIIKLPGTRQEAEYIKKQLTGSGYKINLYTEKDATEETAQELKNPGILHFATHGYFLKETEYQAKEKVFGINAAISNKQPLLRSGLLLANAEYVMKGEETSGILTAFEVMNMQLDKTGIVVLSACETGLGDVKNGEGVYGLQRAFKVAGADAIIMSLWKVDDLATQELMKHFYKNLAKGAERTMAFRKAQLELKKKYPDPVYWGAFILVE